ncbi:hypothetical protein AB0E74_25750 [Streptomyces sp. NPDC030392]|uniref:hypothetical protein n=1 Tax=Streptomyces sp. NPDC030392 TaxID=3155468 RepID=UPI0033CA83AE
MTNAPESNTGTTKAEPDTQPHILISQEVKDILRKYLQDPIQGNLSETSAYVEEKVEKARDGAIDANELARLMERQADEVVELFKKSLANTNQRLKDFVNSGHPDQMPAIMNAFTGASDFISGPRVETKVLQFIIEDTRDYRAWAGKVPPFFAGVSGDVQRYFDGL